MPRTVEEGFRDFLPKLKPLSIETDAAKKHRASIKTCLSNKYNLMHFFRTGSFGNGTSIAGYSDVDYFASIPKEHLNTNSNFMLRKMRFDLAKRFFSTTVGASSPAIKVRFGIGPSGATEIVPAVYIGKRNGHNVYKIADCSGGWQQSSPDTHNSYIRKIDAKLGGKVKPLIRFIKAWKFFRVVPISSFYLELQIAKYIKDESPIEYSSDVARILNWLDTNGLPAVRDPLNISGLINACGTRSQFVIAKRKLATAASRARRARFTECRGKTLMAFNCWKLLYNRKFPNYYL